jgi:hypothetical protein
MMVKVYGIIGDCPALKLMLNHISHVGYYCCWFCKVEGIHVNGKRQYYYQNNFPVRDSVNFLSDSKRAQYEKSNINGRLGISVLDKVVDIPLPKSIIADYLHVTLLRHGKTICQYLYKKIMKPHQRTALDKKMTKQRFPNFFNRKIRSLSDPYLKYKIS